LLTGSCSRECGDYYRGRFRQPVASRIAGSGAAARSGPYRASRARAVAAGDDVLAHALRRPLHR
jgi:hypothetical protein